MKKTFSLLLAILFCNIAQADDNNTLYFYDTIVMPGETSSLVLCMRNTASNLTCLEAEIQLPEGLSVVMDEDDNPVTTLLRNRTAGHEVLTNVLDNGNLKLLISSIDNNSIKGFDGPILSLHVQASKTSPIGECSAETVGETLLVSSQAETYYCIGILGNVLITDDPTNIASSSLDINQSKEIYDLSGRRINSTLSNVHLQSGILIKGGRKKLYK